MIGGEINLAQLLKAIEQGNLSNAREILKSQPALVNAEDENGQSVLMLAILQNDNNFIKDIIQLNPDLEHVDNTGRTAAHYAAHQGNLEAVKLLKEKGANLWMQDNNSISITSFAGASGNLELLAYLHSLNFDLFTPDALGKNAMRHAAEVLGNREILLFGASRGLFPPDVALQMAFNLAEFTALEELINKNVIKLDDAFIAAVEADNRDIAESLISKGANVNHQNDKGICAIHIAAAQNNTEIVDLLMAKSASLELKSNEGQSIVHFAAKSGNPELFQNMITQADNVNIYFSDEDENGVLPIHLAAQSGNIECLEIAFNNYFNTYAVDNNGLSIVDYAVESRNPQAVKYANSKEGGFLHRDENGGTVLHKAAFKANEEFNPAFAALTKYIEDRNVQGFSPFHVAAIFNNSDFIENILAFGDFNIDHVDEFGGTALFLAINNGNLDIARTLINWHAEILHTNQMGETALHVAVRKGNIQAIQLLMAANSHCKDMPDDRGLTPLQAYLTTTNPQPDIIQALGYDPESVLAVRNHQPNINQSKLNKQLVEYSTKMGYETTYIDVKGNAHISYIDNEGNCSGWAMLFPYYVSIGREQEFYDILDYISRWDGNLESLKSDEGLSDNLKYFSDGSVKYKNGVELFEQVHSNLVLFQTSVISKDFMPELKYNDRKTQWDLVTNNETSFNSFFGISSDKKMLKNIQEYLEVARHYPGLTLDFAIFNDKSGHAVSVYVTPEGNFKFYDSNFKTKLDEIESSEIIAKILNRTIEDANKFTVQFSQFSDPKVNAELINHQQLLSDFAKINPNIAQAALNNALKTYPKDIERLQKDIDLIVQQGLVFDQKIDNQQTPIEYARLHCNDEVVALLENAASILKSKATESSDAELEPDMSLKVLFEVTLSELTKECESLNPKLPSQSGRAKLLFSANTGNGSKVTQLGIQREQQLQQLATLFQALAKEPFSEQIATDAYTALSTIKENTSDPGLKKLCEKYAGILEIEKPNISKRMDVENVEASKPSKSI